ncbi:MAG: choice-of-anchor J domain-containing protein, partial [Muribaculaceae bacterium]|nr:choice-of-anchor J domain-containing protein [Muribaculaceae bacterium]
MKKYYLPIIALALSSGAQAQTILDEGFETGNTGNALQPIAAGAGWTTVNSYSGSNASYNWHNYYSDPNSQAGSTISGACCAAVDAPMMINATDGAGPREEILLSPELDLNDTYQLQFTFRVSPINCSDNGRYDLQVRVVEGDNLAGAETIFSIQNEKMLRESGISGFPIQDWSPRTAKVDLSDFQGEKVKLAFVYKMLTDIANVVWLDDITVKQHTPATGPVATLSMNRFTFPAMFIGEKIYSDPITLTNSGKDGLRITGIDCPEGVTTTLNTAEINLLAYQSVMFNVAYTASLTSPASGQVVLHTTGGDVTIDIAASKQFLPEGSTLETFEAYFPPAGWANSGWGWNTNAFEGDHCAYQPGDFSATWLRSPRLDLIDGGSVSFSYFNSYDGDYAPEYDITLQLSTDGGETWLTKWTSDYQNGLNQMLTETVDLGLGSDNCYVRWYYPAVETDDEGAFDHSIFYLDRVVLPKIFGADGVPSAVSNPTPAAGTTDVYPKGVTLS